MTDTKIKEEFNRYVDIGRNLPKQAPDKMLIAYGYYKQALEGDNDSERPSVSSDVVKTFMHDQWCRMKGMSRVEAMKKYIDYIKAMMVEANIKV